MVFISDCIAKALCSSSTSINLFYPTTSKNRRNWHYPPVPHFFFSRLGWEVDFLTETQIIIKSRCSKFQTQCFCHSCTPDIAFLLGNAGDIFNKVPPLRVLAVKRLISMNSYLHLSYCHWCTFLILLSVTEYCNVANLKPEDFFLPNLRGIVCNTVTEAGLQKHGCYPFFTICTFLAYAIMFLSPHQSSYVAQMVLACSCKLRNASPFPCPGFCVHWMQRAEVCWYDIQLKAQSCIKIFQILLVSTC